MRAVASRTIEKTQKKRGTMRNKIATALLAMALGLAATACDTGSSVNTKADKPGNHKTDKGSSDGGSDNSSSGSGEAVIGDPVTVSGTDTKVQVTAIKVLPTVLSSDQYFGPSKGHRWVAVQFQINNTGSKAYDDSPSNGAKVIDTKGQQYDATITTGIKAGPELPAETKIVPGGKALGYITFEVPIKAKIVQVQFSMDSGFGDTAQWNVK